MKTIQKGEADPCLDQAKEAGWNWDEFHRNDQDGYWMVKQQALEEQLNECAYTGLWLGKGTTQQVHLDHFRKKGIYESLTFAYENLFAAAKDLPYGSDWKDKNIHGPKKVADAQYDTFWSPCHLNLEEAFWYRQDGVMLPAESLSKAEREEAQHTIDMYNLNHVDLIQRRAGILKILQSLSGCEEAIVRSCMNETGFSFLVNFELKHRE